MPLSSILSVKDVNVKYENPTLRNLHPPRHEYRSLKKLNSVACSPQANYTDLATAAC
jgi:hypothetical protein